MGYSFFQEMEGSINKISKMPPLQVFRLLCFLSQFLMGESSSSDACSTGVGVTTCCMCTSGVYVDTSGISSSVVVVVIRTSVISVDTSCISSSVVGVIICTSGLGTFDRDSQLISTKQFSRSPSSYELLSHNVSSV